MEKYKCIKKIIVEKCDDDGFLIENKHAVIPVDSIWLDEEDKWRLVGGEVRLTNDKYGWLEIPKEILEEYFEKMEIKTHIRTVGELINELKEYDREKEVVIIGEKEELIVAVTHSPDKVLICEL